MDNNQGAKKDWLASNLEDWEFRRLYHRELVAESFITTIECVMEERGVTKAELAKRMECSAANVSRAMRKTTNMTIATMVDMALSLDLCVGIELKPLAAEDCSFSPMKNTVETWHPAAAGCVSFIKREEFAEVAQEGASASWTPWTQDVNDAEALLACAS